MSRDWGSGFRIQARIYGSRFRIYGLGFAWTALSFWASEDRHHPSEVRYKPRLSALFFQSFYDMFFDNDPFRFVPRLCILRTLVAPPCV